MNYQEKQSYLEQLKQNEFKDRTQILEIVKKIVQPEVNQALIMLMHKLSTIQVVQNYQEKIQSQKFADKREQKKHEKERLKFELGSEYESSEESNFMDDYDGQNKESSLDNEDNNDDIENNDNNFEIAINKDNAPFSVEEIKEAENEEEHAVSPKIRNKFIEHKLTQFNPLEFLALSLKEIIGQPVNYREINQEECNFCIEEKKQKQEDVVDNLSEIKSTAA